jgi:hypothetical protein
MPPRSSSITSLSLTGVQIFSCRYLGTKAGTRGPPSIGGCCKSSNLTSIRNLPRPALRGEGWGGGAASGNCIMTTGSYIADSTEFLTSLYFALTSILSPRRGRISFYCSADVFGGLSQIRHSWTFTASSNGERIIAILPADANQHLGVVPQPELLRHPPMGRGRFLLSDVDGRTRASP